MAPPKSYFIDENMLPVARALDLVRTDVVHPGHPDLPEVPLGTLDHDWLPIVGERGLIVITRDKRIRYRSVEAAAIRDNNVRAFFLTGSDDLTKWGKLELVVRQFEKVERYIEKNPRGPWTTSITKAGVKDMPLW